MRTVYFPFTAVDPRQAERLAAVWGPLTLLQPSLDMVLPDTRRLQEAGTIELVFPSKACREGGLQEALKVFEQWAAQHAGSDRGALLELVRSFPFSDSRFAAQLASEIRRGGRETTKTSASVGRSSLFDAQLVLAMAQKLDCQQMELAHDMDAMAAKEEKMLALLRGENGLAERRAESSGTASAASATAMLAVRLKAWARIMATTAVWTADGGPPENEILFLTDAPDVPAHLDELLPEMVYRLRSRPATGRNEVGGEAVDPPGWLVALRPGATARVREAGGDLIEIPGIPPLAFLAHLAGRRLASEAPGPNGTVTVSTWIGCHPPPHDNVGTASEPTLLEL